MIPFVQRKCVDHAGQTEREEASYYLTVGRLENHESLRKRKLEPLLRSLRLSLQGHAAVWLFYSTPTTYLDPSSHSKSEVKIFDREDNSCLDYYRFS